MGLLGHAFIVPPGFPETQAGVILTGRSDEWTGVTHMDRIEATVPAADRVATVGPPFDEFYRNETSRLVGLAHGLCPPSPAEDVAQEAMLVAYRRWSTVCRLERPETWLRRPADGGAPHLVRTIARCSGTCGHHPLGLTWAPDRTQIAVTLPGTDGVIGGPIYSVRPDGSGWRTLADGHYWGRIAWQPVRR